MPQLISKAVSNHAGMRLLIVSVALLMLGACGGTKVYNNDKTIVYRDNIYNVSTVKQIGTDVSAKLADDSVVDLTHADKKAVQSLLKANDNMFVTMKFELDSDDLVYRAKSVKKYSDYSRMRSDFDSANKKIIKLMGDKKKMQLKLR